MVDYVHIVAIGVNKTETERLKFGYWLLASCFWLLASRHFLLLRSL